MSKSDVCSFWFRYIGSDDLGRLVLARRLANIIVACRGFKDDELRILCLAEFLMSYFDDLLRCSEYLWQRRSASEPRTEPPANER